MLRLADGRIAAIEPLTATSRAAPTGSAFPGALGDDALGDDATLLLPALADAHVHLVASAADRAGVDLADHAPETVAGVCAVLARAARTLEPGSWLRASGFDETWLVEQRFPTLAELDRAVPEHALRLRHATRHASLLNSTALARVEQALGPLDPARAPHEHDGSRSGIVHDLEPEITRVVGPLGAAALDAALRDVGRELARHGVVHLDEVTASNDAERVRRLAAAVASGALPQRVRVYLADPDDLPACERAADGRVAIAGVKLLARSTDEARSPELRERIARARRRGLPVAVHAVEADVVAEVLDVLASAPPRAPGGPAGPDRLEHCSLCPPELVARLAASRVAVVTQPAFLAARGVKYQTQVEPPLWPWLYPLHSLRAAGVLVAGGSDAPVVPLDPRLGLDGAVRRRTRDGTVLALDQALDDAAALDLFTTAAARVRGEGGPHGIVVGAPADLVLAEPGSLAGGWRSLAVRHTLSAGRVIA